MYERGKYHGGVQIAWRHLRDVAPVADPSSLTAQGMKKYMYMNFEIGVIMENSILGIQSWHVPCLEGPCVYQIAWGHALAMLIISARYLFASSYAYTPPFSSVLNQCRGVSVLAGHTWIHRVLYGLASFHMDLGCFLMILKNLKKIDHPLRRMRVLQLFMGNRR